VWDKLNSLTKGWKLRLVLFLTEYYLIPKLFAYGRLDFSVVKITVGKTIFKLVLCNFVRGKLNQSSFPYIQGKRGEIREAVAHG